MQLSLFITQVKYVSYENLEDTQYTQDPDVNR